MIAYLVTNTVNGKQYVGICKTGRFNRRMAEHFWHAKRGKNVAFQVAIREFGKSAFNFEHIASARTWEDIKEVERILITQHDTFWPNGYNMTLGGDGMLGVSLPKESRAKIAAALMGKKHSPERASKSAISRRGLKKSDTWKLKMSARMTGRGLTDAHRKAISSAKIGIPQGPHTAEHNRKIAAANRGRKISDETRAKITGRTFTDDHRAALSAARTGKSYGPQTEEHKRKIADANRGRKKVLSDAGRLALSLVGKAMSARNIGSKRSAATKALLSEKARQRTPNPLAIAKMRATKIAQGATPANMAAIAKAQAARRGVPMAEAHKARIGAANIGRAISLETKEKMSASARTRQRAPMTAETKAKISAAHLGRRTIRSCDQFDLSL